MIAFLWKYMFNPQPDAGLNAMLGFFGLDFAQQNWLGDPSVALWAIGLTVVWQYAGYSMVIFLAALQGIPKDLEEAAALDGAGRWQRFRHIVLPLIAPAMTINLTLSTIGGLKLFDQVFAITGGGPGLQHRDAVDPDLQAGLRVRPVRLLHRRRPGAGPAGLRPGVDPDALPAIARGEGLMLRYRPRTFGLEVLMLAIGLAFLYPVYVLVKLSFEQSGNYSGAWNGAHLGAAMLNSTIITVISLIALVMVGSTAAYYLARTHTRLAYGLYLLFLLGIVLPFQLALVPLYKFMKDTGLLGSYASMILFYTGLQVPFTIFLYTGFLRALPREYGEAALVDGANHWQSFTRVTFPLLRPITGTVVILNAVFVWNDFVTPLVYLGGTPNETLPVVVYQFVGQYVSNWGYIFAAVVVASLPILVVFLLLQRYVIKGFASGLKG